MKMPFGKHKGRDITDIPRSYLCWMLNTIEFHDECLREEVRRVYYGIGEVDEIRSAYLRLAKKYHPDVGGTKEAMQALNEFYEIIGKRRKG